MDRRRSDVLLRLRVPSGPLRRSAQVGLLVLLLQLDLHRFLRTAHICHGRSRGCSVQDHTGSEVHENCQLPHATLRQGTERGVKTTPYHIFDSFQSDYRHCGHHPSLRSGQESLGNSRRDVGALLRRAACNEEGLPIEFCELEDDQVQFHSMIYFVVVTLSTVGYGDITMHSGLAKLCVIMLVCLAVALIPNQTQELSRLIGLQSIYAREEFKSPSDSTHIIICGKLSASAVLNFCQELFHKDHGRRNQMAVILQKNQPVADMLTILATNVVQLKYLQGDPLEEKNLKRADAIKANACILLTDKYVDDPISQDHKNILLGIAVKNYVANNNFNKHIRICMQLIKPEKGDDQIIVVEEIKMNLLAKSCFCPGIIALLGNLVKSAGDQNLDNIQHTYLKEYLSGMGHEIYRVRLSPFFAKMKFVEIADKVYKQNKGIIFCLELQIEGGETLVVLNPGNYEIPERVKYSTFVYIICEDKDVADQVTFLNASEEDVEKINQQEKDRVDVFEAKKMELKRTPDWIEDVSYNDFDNANEGENINLFELDYAVMEEPLNIMNITKITIQNSHKVKDHIVLCGIHSALYSFILPLRARYLRELMHIVILNPEPPGPELWSQISIFPNLIYIRGSPLVNEDLIRAGIKQAKKAVIMESGKMNIAGKNTTHQGNDRMVDAESIFIYKAIKKCNPNLQIMIELVYPSNIEFLETRSAIKEDMRLAKSGEEINYEFMSLYASGEVYISAIIDTLTCQSYYNPHIVTILKQLLSSGQSNTNALKLMGICEEADLRQSNFWQIPVPEDYYNKTFGELFNYLCVQRALVPLALYRMPGATDNERPYVYTNPPDNIKLTSQDKVFVLGNAMPDDLKEAAPGKGPAAQSEETRRSFNFLNEIDDGEEPGTNIGSPGGRENMELHERSHDNNERIESSKFTLTLDIGMGFAIKELENYLNTVEKRLETIDNKFKRQEEAIVEAIKETISDEVELIKRQDGVYY